MQQSSDDRVAHLAGELARMRRELEHLQQTRSHDRCPGRLRSARLVTAVPLLLLGAWVLSAGAPATQDDLEQRVRELEARLLKGPGTTTRIQAPFEVVGPGGNVILQVTHGIPTNSNGVAIFTRGQDGGVVVSRAGHDIAGLGTAEDGDGGLLFIADRYGMPRSEVTAAYVSVLDGGGKVVAAMVAQDGAAQDGRFVVLRGEQMLATLEADDDGGAVNIRNDDGQGVVEIGADDGNGFVATLDPKGRAEVEMGVSEKGDPRLAVSQKGKVRATLGLSINAGHLSVFNSKDQVVANVTGTGPGNGGVVVVGNGSGKGVANLAAGADGAGLVQVFQPGAGPVAVLTQDKSGGLLQIKNESGTPVANLKASTEGGGYWQLTDPGGNPMVEGGSAGGRGIVRAGPYYTCTPAMGTALVGVAMLPDCIRGRDKE